MNAEILEFLKFALPAIGAIAAWFVNERRKALVLQMERREGRYNELLRSIKGFYGQSTDVELKREFLDQVKLCWLYAPDDVILKANVFTDSVDAGRHPRAGDEETQRALAEFVLAVRRDMLKPRLAVTTNLTISDWRNSTVVK